MQTPAGAPTSSDRVAGRVGRVVQHAARRASSTASSTATPTAPGDRRRTPPAAARPRSRAACTDARDAGRLAAPVADHRASAGNRAARWLRQRAEDDADERERDRLVEQVRGQARGRDRDRQRHAGGAQHGGDGVTPPAVAPPKTKYAIGAAVAPATPRGAGRPAARWPAVERAEPRRERGVQRDHRSARARREATRSCRRAPPPAPARPGRPRSPRAGPRAPRRGSSPPHPGRRAAPARPRSGR